MLNLSGQGTQNKQMDSTKKKKKRQIALEHAL